MTLRQVLVLVLVSLNLSVADPEPGWGGGGNPGSGAFLTLDPGSQTHIFDSLMTNFSVKGIEVLSGLAEEKKFLYLFKNKISYNFELFVDKKIVGPTYFSPPLLVLLLDPRSGMAKNQDPGHRNLKTAHNLAVIFL
jgi:hypothetical protein